MLVPRQCQRMTTIGDHLVGRTAEMAAVDDALGVVRGGSTGCLVVEGEPGIGKTRMLAELAGRADARGCTVLAGSAYELERDLPFWVFVDALDEYVAGLDPQLVASLREDVRSELAQVLPAMSDAASAAGAGEVAAASGGSGFCGRGVARAGGGGAAAGAASAGAALEAVGVAAAVIASLTEELGLLSPGTQRMLWGAAGSGDPFEL